MREGEEGVKVREESRIMRKSKGDKEKSKISIRLN